MASPTHSQGSEATVNSPETTAIDSSVTSETYSSRRRFVLPRGVAAQQVYAAPNSVFVGRIESLRSRSASPRLHRTIRSPALSVAQRRAQTAEAAAAAAKKRADEADAQSRHASHAAEAALAEARAAHDAVEKKTASVAANAAAGMSNAAAEVEGRVAEMAAAFEKRASSAVEQFAQQLDAGMKAAATSTATTAKIDTQAAIQGMRCELEAQVAEMRKSSQRTNEEMKKELQELSQDFKNFIEQLNKFQPASVVGVRGEKEQIRAVVDQKLNQQAARIDNLAATVQETAQTAAVDRKSVV